MERPTTSLRYIPELDGIRAGAIAMVLVVHSIPYGQGGILGVDVFFVLSGFLITGLLLGEKRQRGQVDTRNFYARRALRLVPALVVAVAITAVLQNYVDPAYRADLTVALPAVLLYYTNWAIVLHQEVGLFGILWSLALEEQFYLVWPWVLRRWGAARDLARSLILLSAGAVVARIALSASGFELVRYTALRADGLLLGAALAVVAYRDDQVGRLRMFASIKAAAGALAVLVVAAVAVSASHPNDVVRSAAYAAAALATVGLIAHVVAAERESLLRTILRWKPFVAVGRVSYGIYLFHLPIFRWFDHRYGLAPMTLLLEYGATAAVVATSWFVVERPALRLKRHFESGRGRLRSSLNNAL